MAREIDRSLAHFGQWAEGKWAYNAVRQQMAKLYEWRGRAVSKHGQEGLTLRYVSVARCDPARMEELTYVEEQEGKAVAILEAMVEAGCQGVAYLTRPDLVRELDRVLIGEVSDWTTRRAFPEDYRSLLHDKIKATCDHYFLYCQMLTVVQARESEDEARREWGLEFDVEPWRLVVSAS